MLPVALTRPAVTTLPPVMSPVAEIIPVVVCPTGVKITRGLIPFTLIDMLPALDPTNTLLLPFCMVLVIKLVSWLPFPTI
jgi:hypothetical protein